MRWQKGKDDGGSGERMMEAKERECGRKGLGRNTRKPRLHIYTPVQGQQADPAKRQVKFPYLMLLPNRSLETRTYRHVSTVCSLTACHAAHYRAIFTSLLKRRTPTGGKGGLQMDTSKRKNYGLQARYKPRGLKSWPSTRVRQLPSSK
jgi:hypothetical protein